MQSIKSYQIEKENEQKSSEPPKKKAKVKEEKVQVKEDKVELKEEDKKMEKEEEGEKDEGILHTVFFTKFNHNRDISNFTSQAF